MRGQPLAWGLIWLAGVVGAVCAQTPLPGPSQPAQIKAELELTRPQSASPVAWPTLSTEANTLKEDNPVRFILRAVVITGAHRYDQAELTGFFSPVLGQPISWREITALTARITARYRTDGYFLSQAILPAQEIRDGVVHIQIVEGFIDGVDQRGAAKRWTPLTRQLAAGLTKNRPVTIAMVEQALLLIDDLPGLEVRSVLAPSPVTFGAARAALDLRARPIEAFVSLDNRGSRFVGPLVLGAGAQFNSLAGFHEEFTLHTATVPNRPAELHFGAASLGFPFGQSLSGGNLKLGYSRLRTAPTLPPEIFPLETVSEGEEFSLLYSQWLRRSRQRNLRFEVGFSAKDGLTTLAALPRDFLNPTVDHIRVAHLTMSTEFFDHHRAVNLASLSWYQGLDLFNASNGDRVSRRTGADGTFTYFKTTLSRIQPLSETWLLYGRISAQYSLDPLLSAERFGVGGSELGRGFPAGNLTGDSGVAATLELRHNLRRWRSLSLQVYGFVDAGGTWDRGAAGRSNQQLVTSGTGLRVNVGTTLSLNPELGYRLNGDAADGDQRQLRFQMSLIARF